MKAGVRNPRIDIVVKMLDGWRRHFFGVERTCIGFSPSFSIFPLMLVATSILALVLDGNNELCSAWKSYFVPQ